MITADPPSNRLAALRMAAPPLLIPRDEQKEKKTNFAMRHSFCHAGKLYTRLVVASGVRSCATTVMGGRVPPVEGC